MELLSLLTKQLGVTDEQAKGGAGLIFDHAKGELGDADFGKVTDAIPGIGSLLSSASGGGGGGMLGGALSSLGGSGGGGGLASLISGFSGLGLDGSMVGKFIPIILSFVQSKGGDTVKNLLAGVLK